MLSKVTQDPTRSAQSVYEEVRNSFTQNMEAEEKLLFLSNFPTFKDFQTRIYRKRRELIPPNPKTMIDLDVHLPMFQYNRDETIVKGDQVLSDGRRVAVFTSNAHLKLHFSNIEAKGCSFHFSKAIISKISRNGFKSGFNGCFPPSSWVMYNHRGETTNNQSEGYNFRLGHNRSIEKHPNTYRWVETITQELRNSENEALKNKTDHSVEKRVDDRIGTGKC